MVVTQVKVSRTIQAPIDVVFDALTNPERSRDFDPDVVRVEGLSGPPSAGTRFTQVRRGPRGAEQRFELEVVEHVPPTRARMVNETHGTVWDTVYTFEPRDEGVCVTLAMTATAHSFVPRLLNPLLKGMFRRGIRKHLDTAAQHLEQT